MFVRLFVRGRRFRPGGRRRARADVLFGAGQTDVLDSAAACEGKVKVLIDSTFPLRDAAAAHARMESSQHIGKIVLTVG